MLVRPFTGSLLMRLRVFLGIVGAYVTQLAEDWMPVKSSSLYLSSLPPGRYGFEILLNLERALHSVRKTWRQAHTHFSGFYSDSNSLRNLNGLLRLLSGDGHRSCLRRKFRSMQQDFDPAIWSGFPKIGAAQGILTTQAVGDIICRQVWRQ